MNNLINDVFGDPAITLDCDSGECLHYTQVPGYTRPVAPDNSRWVALSAALAALIFVAACLCTSLLVPVKALLICSALVPWSNAKADWRIQLDSAA